jgi:hypothetical protein
MSVKQDIFLRAHTVVIGFKKTKKGRRQGRSPRRSPYKWPKYAVVFDCETRIDTSQDLTFGFYSVLRLQDDAYMLQEEGAFFNDDLPRHEREVLERYASTADTQIKSFPPRFPLYSRSHFAKQVFYRYARKGALIVGFNLPFDLCRLARRWPEGKKNVWSLALVQYADGNENLHFPRVLIDPIDSKKSFISFRAEWIPKDKKRKPKGKPTKINKSRFLDLRTLLFALFNQALSLKKACELEAFKKYNLPQKFDHTPTGRVTIKEIKYAYQDIRCTAALLNAAKHEFDLHPIPTSPDRAYSPASIAKGYLEAMNIEKPGEKFNVSPQRLGIAMGSFLGGRSETRIRLQEVPVVPVDFTSEYPSTCVLLGLWNIVTAKTLTFPDATQQVRKLLNRITLDDCFRPDLWPDLRFFALVRPNNHILPVRTMYNETTPNIGNNYLTSVKPIWIAGPDLIASAIQTGTAPEVIRAMRMVPHGKQKMMQTVSLRGMVEINPYKDDHDLFKRTIEQRKLHKSDKDLYYWLKVFANSMYGFFAEINPEPTPERRPVKVRVYSGGDEYTPTRGLRVKEKQGQWYAPYLASLITSGGRLLLAMLERSVVNAGGTHAWADTDALAIVSSKKGGSLRHVPGCKGMMALSWDTVRQITDKFETLNPYDRSAVHGSILNFVDANFENSDPSCARRQLLGFSIAAKRYALYERSGTEISIVDPKAHGLGYLYPPADSPKGWDDEHDAPRWIYEFWEYLLRMALKLDGEAPRWRGRLQMMRMTVTTFNVLKTLHRWEGFRPYNFFLLPVLAEGGYPSNISPGHFRLVAPFESDQTKWDRLKCINIGDPQDQRRYELTTRFNSSEYGKRAIVEIFDDLFYRYMLHREAKSLSPDGTTCKADTRGLLGRAHIIAGRHRRIGKETDRRWEEGDDLESLMYVPVEYEHPAEQQEPAHLVRARERLIMKIKRIGKRKLVRYGCSRRVLERICRRELLPTAILKQYELRVEEYVSKPHQPDAV